MKSINIKTKNDKTNSKNRNVKQQKILETKPLDFQQKEVCEVNRSKSAVPTVHFISPETQDQIAKERTSEELCTHMSLNDSSSNIIIKDLYKENAEELIQDKHNKDQNLLKMKIPKVNFCEGDITQIYSKSYQPQITDLCVEDKKRIALLVEEIARYKKENGQLQEQVLKLTSKLTELQIKLTTLQDSENAKLKSVHMLDSVNNKEERALKRQVTQLRQLLQEMQKQKLHTNEHVKCVQAKAENLTKVLQHIHKEKTELEQQYHQTKERLEEALQNIRTMVFLNLLETQKLITKNKLDGIGPDYPLQIYGNPEHLPNNVWGKHCFQNTHKEQHAYRKYTSFK